MNFEFTKTAELMIKEALVAKVLRAAKGVVSKRARRANEAHARWVKESVRQGLSQKDLTKRRTPASAILSRIKIKSAKERQTDMINYLADRRARNAIPPDKFKKGYSQKIL